tara:strand:+ start:2238 stop:2498 length:261 start_codon:yes stop_codon:yes gene_type:complete
MPRYKYSCTNCEYTKTYFHDINEKIEICEACEEPTMKKVLGKINLKNKKDSKTNQVGSLTKQYIEENREILNNQKKEAREETYEPS